MPGSDYWQRYPFGARYKATYVPATPRAASRHENHEDSGETASAEFFNGFVARNRAMKSGPMTCPAPDQPGPRLFMRTASTDGKRLRKVPELRIWFTYSKSRRLLSPKQGSNIVAAPLQGDLKNGRLPGSRDQTLETAPQIHLLARPPQDGDSAILEDRPQATDWLGVKNI
jgi:hypothetical protein